MDETFIYLWRSIRQTSFYKDSKTFHLAVHLLLEAAWKDHKVQYKGKVFIQKRGQMIVGRKKLALETGLSEQEIRTSLDKLKKVDFLTIKSTNQFSIITILKYEEYQTKPPPNQPASNQRATSEQPQQNNGNKGNNGNNYFKKENKEKELTPIMTAEQERQYYEDKKRYGPTNEWSKPIRGE